MKKKWLFSILSFYTFYTYAQDTSNCKIKKEIDSYTKETKLSTGFLRFNGAMLTVEATKDEIDFFFVVPDKCFNNASTLQVFFDGSKLKTTYRNAGSMNCDGYFHVLFRNSHLPNSILKKIATQKTSQFIFSIGDKKDFIISLLPAQQEVLMKAVSCMLTQSDKLLPG